LTAVRFDRPAHHPAPLRTAVGRSIGKWLTICGVVVVMGATGALLVPKFFGHINPLAETTVDRTGPVLLTAISDMHTYQAASGQFQVTVDVEKDAKWMPAAIHGEHVVVTAEGSVDAGVDFSKLNPQDIVIDPISKAITITLPHATLGAAKLNLASTKVVAHKRGLFDRLGSTFGGSSTADHEAFRLAEKKLASSARSSDLVARAETNTASMVKQLAAGLGHPNVTVRFAEPSHWTMPPVFNGRSTAGPRDL
jgi:Protein of unknown function (DUF4230)